MGVAVAQDLVMPLVYQVEICVGVLEAHLLRLGSLYPRYSVTWILLGVCLGFLIDP